MPAAAKYPLVVYDSGDNVPEDPMVSGAIRPFIILVTVTDPQSGWCRKYGALIDTGCTMCLISQAMAIELKLLVREFLKPMMFDQVDGSLLGGLPMYSMTPKEMDKLQRYIKKNVATRQSRGSRLPYSSRRRMGPCSYAWISMASTGFAWKTCTPFR